MDDQLTNSEIDSAADERIGQIIDDRYEIREKIANGGMATVYKAHDKRLDRIVAIKIMHSHLANGEQGANFITRFRREARAAAQLNHNGIVVVHDQGVDSNTAYLTMEFIEGTNLRRRLKEVGTFSVGDALKNTESILRALAAAHRAGLVHRDVKPENILINRAGVLKLTDFGLARVASELSTSTTGSVFGTVSYLAPEIIETGQSDARADCYSVGIILYEMLAGVQPFEGSTPIQIAYKHVHENIPSLCAINPQISPAISKFIEVLCSRDLMNRPIDAAKSLELLVKVASTLTAAELAVKLPTPKLIQPASEQLVDSDHNAFASYSPSSSPSSSINEQETQRFDNAVSQPSSIPTFTPATPQKFNTSGKVRPFAPEVTDPDKTVTNLLTSQQLKTIRNASGTNQTNSASSVSGYPAIKLLTATGSSLSISRIKSDSQLRKELIRKRLFIVAAALALILLLTALVWFLFAGPGSKIEVPQIAKSQPLEQVKSTLENAQVRYEVKQEFSDTIEEGQIISFAPESGTHISKKFGSVEIVVSKGIEKKTVPQSVVNSNFSQVVDAIKKAGFTDPTLKRVYSQDVEKDRVVSISVPEGASLPHTTKITLEVSDGKKPVTAPALVGSSFTNATANCEKLGLKLEKTEEFSETVKAGEIIKQDPVQGKDLFEGDTINVTVSKGSENVIVPNVVKLTKEAAQKALAEAGLKYAIEGEGILGVVQKQSVASGQKVKRDTVVTITVV